MKDFKYDVKQVNVLLILAIILLLLSPFLSLSPLTLAGAFIFVLLAVYFLNQKSLAVNEQIQSLVKQNKILKLEKEFAEHVGDSSHCGIALLSQPDLIIEYINDFIPNLVGKSKGEFLNQKCVYLAEKFNDEFIEKINNGNVEVIETEVVNKDNQTIPFYMVVKRIRYANNDKILCNIFDVSKLKEAELLIKKKEKLMENYLNLSAEIVLALNEEGRITFLNESGHKLLGYKYPDLIGWSWFNHFVPKRDVNKIKGVFKELIAGGEASLKNYENNVLCRDRKEKTVLWHNDIIKDDDGNIVEVISSGQDITERKRFEEEVKNSKELLNLVIKGTGDGMWEWDLNTNNVVYSERFFEILGYTTENTFQHLDFFEGIIHNNDREYFFESIRNAIVKRTDKYLVEYRAKKSDGEYIWMSARGEIVKDENDIPYKIVGLHRDISKRKKYELELIEQKRLAEQSDVAKSAFIANISHEMRTPLSSIIGFGDVLLNSLQEDEAKNIVRNILNGGKSLLLLINDLIQISEIEANKEKVQNSPTRLKELIEEVSKEFMPKAKGKNIEFTVKYDGDTPDVVIIDEEKLRQILMNLIGNAVKFTSKGGVELIINSNTIQKRFVSLQIQVNDTGIGISEEFIPKLFKPFSQESYNDNRLFEGTGLGLIITKKLCELLGGTVEFKSRIGIGTSFTISFPKLEFRSGDSISELSNVSESKDSNLIFETFNLLYFGASTEEVNNLQAVLSELNIKMFSLLNPEELIQLFEIEAPRALVIDFSNNLNKAIEIADRIKSNPVWKDVCVFALNSEELLDSYPAIKAILDGYIHKPIAKLQIAGLFRKHFKFFDVYRNYSLDIYQNFKNYFVDLNEEEKKCIQALDKSKLIDRINKLILLFNTDDILKFIEQMSGLPCENKENLSRLVLDLQNSITNLDFKGTESILNKFKEYLTEEM